MLNNPKTFVLNLNFFK